MDREQEALYRIALSHRRTAHDLLAAGKPEAANEHIKLAIKAEAEIERRERDPLPGCIVAIAFGMAALSVFLLKSC